MPIETFHISSKSTHNKQQVDIKSICTKERGKKVMTTTNVFKFVELKRLLLSNTLLNQNSYISLTFFPLHQKYKSPSSRYHRHLVLVVVMLVQWCHYLVKPPFPLNPPPTYRLTHRSILPPFCVQSFFSLSWNNFYLALSCY